MNTDWAEYSVTLDDRYTIGPVTLNAGVRYDGMNIGDISGTKLPPGGGSAEIDGHWSPQVGLSWEVTPKTLAKLSCRHGYRTPDAVYYRSTLLANDYAEGLGLSTYDLQVETMDSYEFNLHHRTTDDLDFGLALFHNVFKDQLSWTSIESVWGAAAAADMIAAGSLKGMFANLAAEEEATGAELMMNWRYGRDSGVQCSYSYVEVGNGLVQRIPVDVLKVSLYGDLFSPKFHYFVNYVYGSSMENVGNPSPDHWNDAYKQDAHTVNLALSYDVTENSSLTLRAHNLFEDDRPTTTFKPGAPAQGYLGTDERRVYLGYRIRF